MIVEYLEAANGTFLRLGEPFLDALLHEEVLEVARQHDDVLVHLSHFVAQPALRVVLALLIEFVQLIQAVSLELQYVVLVSKHGELGVFVEASTKLHEDLSLISHRPPGHYYEDEYRGYRPN